MHTIEIKNLKPDVDIYCKAVKLYLKKNYTFSYYYKLIVGILLVALSVIIVTNSKTSNEFKAIATLIFFPASIFYLYQQFTIRKRLEKSFEKQTEDEVSEKAYSINEEGYSESTKGKFSKYEWDYFKKAIITKDLIILEQPSTNITYFSNRNYSESDFELIKKWVSNKVKIIE